VSRALRKSLRKRGRGRPRRYASNAARQWAYRQRRKHGARPVYRRDQTQIWETPRDVFDTLDAEFHFTLDVCALPSTTKCPRYFTPDHDGLAQDWGGEVCYANPPYGLILRRWVQKSYEASKAGATVVLLVPVRTDTVWWQTYVIPYAAEVRFLARRLKFGGTPHNAPFPSALVIFRPPAH
jgi:phage N-6-adenine-methyltransferase